MDAAARLMSVASCPPPFLAQKCARMASVPMRPMKGTAGSLSTSPAFLAIPTIPAPTAIPTMRVVEPPPPPPPLLRRVLRLRFGAAGAVTLITGAAVAGARYTVIALDFAIFGSVSRPGELV